MDAKQTKQLIAARNDRMREEFIKLCTHADWRLLTKTDTVDPDQINRLIVIGVALWSPTDLQALNRLAEQLSDRDVAVFVFDIDEFGSSDGAKAFIPGLEMPNKTPVIAEYIGGILVQSSSGNAAFQWIKDL